MTRKLTRADAEKTRDQFILDLLATYPVQMAEVKRVVDGVWQHPDCPADTMLLLASAALGLFTTNMVAWAGDDPIKTGQMESVFEQAHEMHQSLAPGPGETRNAEALIALAGMLLTTVIATRVAKDMEEGNGPRKPADRGQSRPRGN